MRRAISQTGKSSMSTTAAITTGRARPGQRRATALAETAMTAVTANQTITDSRASPNGSARANTKNTIAVAPPSSPRRGKGRVSAYAHANSRSPARGTP